MSSVSAGAPERSRQLEGYLALLPEPERRLLQGCALISRFDQAIIGELDRAMGLAGAVTLADLTEYPFVQEQRGKPGWYRLRDDARRVFLDMWWEGQPPGSGAPDVAAVSAGLADRLEQIPGADPDDAVGLRLFAGPLGAAEQWKDLYAQADGRFDIVRCRRLLGLLGWAASVTPEIEALREDYETYVEARSLWTDEWYRTGSFLLPAASREAMECLLAGQQGRMLELRGYGGYGKTMHIRWLIARRCVPADARIPCARIDFDVVDPIAATREPHLLLLEMADQLDQQLAGDAFGRLVRTYSSDRARLYRRARATKVRSSAANDPADDGTRPGAADDVLRRFGGRLAELRPDQPVVLILDTLEVPMHLPDTPGGSAIKPLLGVLAAVQEQAPCVRIILSGRYEISEDLRRLFEDRCEPFELPKFSPAEARDYLVKKRHIERAELVKAAVRASDCVPFSLALMADLIDQEPDIDPGKIAEYHRAEYAYLIEKVVKRIKEQPVRWVLRYAALPRRFDFEFVRDVLWPRVREEMAGEGGHDQPDSDDLPRGAEEDGKAVWEVGEPQPGGEATVREVWEQVRRYASGSSWIRPDENGVDALRLQTEVVRPLRELLRSQEIFSVLHADAAAYFLRRAEDETPVSASQPGEAARDRRQEFLREAVFHRFQADGPAAGAWWEAQIGKAEGPLVRLALADELARQPDYTAADGRPERRGDGGLLVSEQTLQEARLELCLANAELASLQSGMPSDQLALIAPPYVLWRDASDALERLASAPLDALPSGRVALARAAVAIGTGERRDIAGDVRSALDGPGPSSRERLWIATLNAYRLLVDGSAEADSQLEEAKRLERDAMADRDVRRLLAMGLAQRQADRGALDEAVATCVAAIDEGLGDFDFRLVEAMLRLLAGDAESARAVARAADDGSALTLLAGLVEVRSLRRQGRFKAAAASVQHFLAALDQYQKALPYSGWIRASALLEKGEISAWMLLVSDARAAFAEATRLFQDAGDPEGAAGCYLEEARLMLNGLGHLRAAGVALDYAERVAPSRGDVTLFCQLTRGELAHSLGERPTAAAILARAGSGDPRAALPMPMAAAAVAGLAFGGQEDRDRYTRQLADALAQVTPPSARLHLVSRAVRCPPLNPKSKGVRRLGDVAVPAGGWDGELAGLATADCVALRIRAAAFARMRGDADGALDLLLRALQDAAECEEPLGSLRDILRLARLLRSAALVADAGGQALAHAVRQASAYPLLAAATVIEYLEATLETGMRAGEEHLELCVQAEKWLNGGEASAEAWQARQAKLRAALTSQDDDTKYSYLRAAIRLYDAAGDAPAAEEVQHRVPGPHPGLATGKSKIVVNVTMSWGSISSKVDGGRSRLFRRRATVTLPLRTTITQWAQGASTDPYPPRLPDLMVGSWDDFRLAVADLLDAGEVAARTRRGADREDLAIRVYDGALQRIPWELARAAGSDRPLMSEFRRAYRAPANAAPDTRLVRVVQAGLNLITGSALEVDGVSGPDTAKALAGAPGDVRSDEAGPSGRTDDPVTVQRLHQELLSGHRPTVIVVWPAQGEGRHRSQALERRYSRQGFEVITVDQVHLSALSALLRSEPPPVIVHVIGGLVATAGAIGIDLQGDTWGWSQAAEPGLLAAADLDQALRAVPPDWPAPVVVLDVPVPTGQREAADQLLLRNGFAADLFAMGGARAVVGTGLAGKALGDVHNVLVERMAAGDAIGDVIQEMRRLGQPAGFGSFDSAAAFAGTALWSHDAALRLPAVGD
jgi:hypothetical protein